VYWTGTSSLVRSRLMTSALCVARGTIVRAVPIKPNNVSNGSTSTVVNGNKPRSKRSGINNDLLNFTGSSVTAICIIIGACCYVAGQITLSDKYCRVISGLGRLSRTEKECLCRSNVNQISNASTLRKFDRSSNTIGTVLKCRNWSVAIWSSEPR